MAFICGSHRSQVEDDYDVLWPFPSTSPKKAARKGRSKKNTRNPYSDRGLDKFEALLADLDHKRQKILTQKGSEDVNMVKFVYRSPDEVRPIVVKLRDHRKHDNNASSELAAFVKGKTVKPWKIKSGEWRRKIGGVWKPWYSLALFVILVLVLLMFSGRSFAILCTSLGWYMLPIIHRSLHISKTINILNESFK